MNESRLLVKSRLFHEHTGMKYHISLNQFVEFYGSSNYARTKIIKQQLVPDKVLIPWYQGAKAAMRKYYRDVQDVSPLVKGIETITKKIPDKRWKEIDKASSIQALQIMLQLHIAPLLRLKHYELVIPETKILFINDVEIAVTPDIIFKSQVNGRVVYGAVKTHVSKGKRFDLEQCQIMAAVILKYLNENVVEAQAEADPRLCIAIDVFAERVVNAAGQNMIHTNKIRSICQELKEMWTKYLPK